MTPQVALVLSITSAGTWKRFVREPAVDDNSKTSTELHCDRG